MKKIITISREFGAGGGEIGRKVAERLGYHYYDKELILRSADTSKVDVESMRRWDEKVPANFGFAQSLFNFYNKPLNETLFDKGDPRNRRERQLCDCRQKCQYNP